VSDLSQSPFLGAGPRPVTAAEILVPGKLTLAQLR